MTGIRTFDDLRLRCKMVPSPSKRYPGECWEWHGATSRAGGSPSIWIPSLQRVGTVGTLSSVIATGSAAPASRVYRAMCDTPHCCNPEHRRWLSQAAATRKTHAGKPLAVAHKARITASRRAGSHITAEAIALLRAHPAGVSVAGLAAELGVSLSYAGAIKAGKRRPAVSPFAALMTGAA